MANDSNNDKNKNSVDCSLQANSLIKNGSETTVTHEVPQVSSEDGSETTATHEIPQVSSKDDSETTATHEIPQASGEDGSETTATHEVPQASSEDGSETTDTHEVPREKKVRLKELFKIFITFLKIGLFTFGGGYAMIPLIQKEAVEKHKWVSDDDILEIIAIAESTPGPIAINSATFIGHKVAGFLGSLFATLGVVLPSFVIIFALSFVFEKFNHFRAVRYAFWGIRAGVLALILKSLVGMIKKAEKNVVSIILMVISAVIATLVHGVAIFVILGCAVIGLVFSLIKLKGAKK